MGLPPLRGRTLTSADIDGAANVVVISRSLAAEYFGDEDPLGQYLELPDFARPPYALADTAFRVIGIVDDVGNQGPWEAGWPSVYLPTTLTAVGNTPREIVVRTAGDPAAVISGLERAVRELDADVTVAGAYAVNAMLSDNVYAQPRFSFIILSVFAAVGLVLVAVGVYSVMTYAVSRRAQEFAIRMALGATHRDVLRVVLTSGALLLAWGIVAGLVASRATDRLVRSIVGATQADVASGIGAVVVIAIVGIVACLVPALRAARTSPMRALRMD